MLKRMKSFKSLSKKVNFIHEIDHHDDDIISQQALLGDEGEEGLSTPSSTNKVVPSGFFAIYVGQDRERFVVPTTFLAHPLFKILLEKAYDEFGFEQQSGLVVPCRVSTFREVVNAVQTNNGRFDMRELFEEFA